MSAYASRCSDRRSFGSPPHHRSAREIAVIAAATDARLRSEAEAWNPTLNVLACRPWEIWPLAEQNYRRSGRRPTVFPYCDDIVRSICEEKNSAVSLKARLRERVIPALAPGSLSIDDAKRLLESLQSDELLVRVIEAAPADLDFVRWLAENKSSLLSAVAAKPDLAPEIAAELWGLVVRALTDDAFHIPSSAITTNLHKRGALPADALEQVLELSDHDEVEIDRLLVGTVFALFWARDPDPTEVEKLCRHLLSRTNYVSMVAQALFDHSKTDPERRARKDRLRTVARAIARIDPPLLNKLETEAAAHLEPEDWLPVFQVQQWPEETAEALLHIPTARNHPATRRFIFENGPKTTVLEWLEHGPIRPEERRVAALSILREAPEEADAVFLRWPKLKDVLEIEDVTVLLQSKNASIRQKGILLLAEIHDRISRKKCAPKESASDRTAD